MNEEPPLPKYAVSAGKIDQTVCPRPPGDFPVLQEKSATSPSIWSPRCSRYQRASALPLAAAAPPPPGTVVISNVNVNRNSLSGTVANLSWSTNPTSSCDSVTYQVSGQSSHTITPPCKVHSASLTGLAVHVTTT